jgi:hypothetical protein
MKPEFLMGSRQSPEQHKTGPEPGNRVATATYIAELCTALAKLARDDRFTTLAYILDMARLEAEAAAQGMDTAEPRRVP